MLGSSNRSSVSSVSKIGLFSMILSNFFVSSVVVGMVALTVFAGAIVAQVCGSSSSGSSSFAVARSLVTVVGGSASRVNGGSFGVGSGGSEVTCSGFESSSSTSGVCTGNFSVGAAFAGGTTSGTRVGSRFDAMFPGLFSESVGVGRMAAGSGGIGTGKLASTFFSGDMLGSGATHFADLVQLAANVFFASGANFF